VFSKGGIIQLGDTPFLLGIAKIALGRGFSVAKGPPKPPRKRGRRKTRYHISEEKAPLWSGRRGGVGGELSVQLIGRASRCGGEPRGIETQQKRGGKRDFLFPH